MAPYTEIKAIYEKLRTYLDGPIASVVSVTPNSLLRGNAFSTPKPTEARRSSQDVVSDLFGGMQAVLKTLKQKQEQKVPSLEEEIKKGSVTQTRKELLWILPNSFDDARQDDFTDEEGDSPFINEDWVIPYVFDNDLLNNLVTILDVIKLSIYDQAHQKTIQQLFVNENQRLVYENFVRLFARMLYFYSLHSDQLSNKVQKYIQKQEVEPLTDTKRFALQQTILSMESHLNMEQNEAQVEKQTGLVQQISQGITEEGWKTSQLRQVLPILRQNGMKETDNMCVMTGWSGLEYFLYHAISNPEYTLSNNLLKILKAVHECLKSTTKKPLDIFGPENWWVLTRCIDDSYSVLNTIKEVHELNSVGEFGGIEKGGRVAYEFYLHWNKLNRKGFPRDELLEVLKNLTSILDTFSDTTKKTRVRDSGKSWPKDRAPIVQEQMLTSEILQALAAGVPFAGANQKKYFFVNTRGNGRCWLYAIMFGLYYYDYLSEDDKKSRNADAFRNKIIDAIPDDKGPYKTMLQQNEFEIGGDYEFSVVAGLYKCEIHALEHYKCNANTEGLYLDTYCPMRALSIGSGLDTAKIIRVLNTGGHYGLIFPENDHDKVVTKIQGLLQGCPALANFVYLPAAAS